MKRQITGGTAAALCVLTAIGTFNVTVLAMRSGLNRLLPSYTAQQAVYGKLGEIKDTIDTYFVGEYDEEEALNMAAAGYVLGIGDRWSAYLPAEQYEAYKLSFDGQLVGIGVAVTYDESEDAIHISDVYEGSPAEKAGLQRGDYILGADDVTVAQDGYAAVVSAVTGEENTEVRLTVRYAQSGDTAEITCARKKVDKVAVRGQMLADHIGYLRIHDFDGGADTQFLQEMRTLIDEGAEALIFDVRFNPGGSVAVLSNMLDALLPEGTIITLRPKTGDEEKVYTSDVDEVALPMAVLVNAESISAGEFFPAALQEYGKAVVVGEKTIGKGYSQRQFPLSDGSALILSNQMYFTPKGKNLAGSGITPDIEVELSREKQRNFAFLEPADDDQLQAALSALKARDAQGD